MTVKPRDDCRRVLALVNLLLHVPGQSQAYAQLIPFTPMITVRRIFNFALSFRFRRLARKKSLIFCLAGMSSSLAAQPVALTVQAGGSGKPISRDLFGIFFEDLNYAADGGLYAELIENRSFEYDATEQNSWNSLTAWDLVERGGGKGGVAVKSSRPLHPNNPHYVALSVKQPGDGVGLSNRGYSGIPVTGGDTYNVSFFSHQLFMNEPWGGDNGIAGRPMPVSVRLESPAGEVLASASLQVVGRDWKRWTAKITASRTERAARLVFLVHAKGGIALDEVSLFPEKTFHHRENGLRADLAQCIADLKPKFMRFPGGCLAHGDGVGNFYRWKNTIGPVEQRKGQRNLWGYHQSVGLGYFEFFQFCEDIGAKPLPVVAAGVSCQNSDSSPGMGQACVPIEDMAAYVQEILDLIEWANGPATSTWGRRRAAAGHPAPFGLKYLGVGNEDKITADFAERFKLIQRAVTARYPDITIIGTAGPFPSGEDFDRGWKLARELKVPVVDEHYYVAPDWFWKNQDRYDHYDRPGPKVYVGEYAAHEKDRRNTLRTALAEAAACTAFERNGDVVQLASYAPLLARRQHTQWTPDMIYFTSTGVFRTINYYVQQLMCTNSGDVSLPATLASSAGRRLVVSCVRDSASSDLILKIVNGDDTPASLHLTIEGLSSGLHPATRTLLGGVDPDSVNTDDKPMTVTPETSEMTVASRFDLEVPRDSLVVLRVKDNVKR
jgi:alpha-L-arabinofuranosidase